jgi:CBS domain-containing protein
MSRGSWLNGGQGKADMYVSEILDRKGRDVIAVGPDDPVSDAMRALSDNDVGAVLVVDGEALKGLLSERDIVRAITDTGTDVLGRPTRDFMRTEVRTCTPDQTVEALLDQMIDGHIKHLPVVDGGNLRGVVSMTDVIQSGLQELRDVKKTLEDYIQHASQRSFADDD